MLEEMEMEAERFAAWNERHQGGVRLQDNTYNGHLIGAEGQPELPNPPDEVPPETMEEIRLRCVKKIGDKVVAGLEENTAEGDPIDLPLRLDHVRDMVGRRNIEDPQGEPKDILDRLHERVPESAPASEAIVHKTGVEGPGPTQEEMDAAAEEQTSWTDDPTAMTDEQLADAIANHPDSGA